MQVGAPHVCAVQVGPMQVCAVEVGAPQGCAMQIGAMQVGVGQQRAAEVGRVQIASVQVGALARFPPRRDPLPMTVENGHELFSLAGCRPELAAAVPASPSFSAGKASVHFLFAPHSSAMFMIHFSTGHCGVPVKYAAVD